MHSLSPSYSTYLNSLQKKSALSFNAYFPTLTATLGFSNTITLLLCAPPWALTAFVAFIWSRHSDKTQERCFHVIIPFFVGIIGFVIASATENIAARYISLFLMALSYCGFIVLFVFSLAVFNCSTSDDSSIVTHGFLPVSLVRLPNVRYPLLLSMLSRSLVMLLDRTSPTCLLRYIFNAFYLLGTSSLPLGVRLTATRMV